MVLLERKREAQNLSLINFVYKNSKCKSKLHENGAFEIIYSDHQNNFFKTECVGIFASDLNKSIVILAQNEIDDRVLIIWNAETD